MFNGTKPSNEGCTNGVSIDGQMTIDYGQGTTLIDCNQGFNGRGVGTTEARGAWLPCILTRGALLLLFCALALVDKG